MSDSTHQALEQAVVDGFPATIADLTGLVRIPSVSWDGFDPAQVQASAERVVELLTGTGVFDSIRIERASKPDGTPGQPAVLATRARPGRPTVLLYAHHDVQPPGKDEDWDTPPYEPTLKPAPEGDRLYARGAADDKAGILVHVAAIRALIEVLGPDPDLGIKVFVEGEEEYGSPSFKDLILTHRDDLAADAIVVADGGNWDTETPAITSALRGNATFVLTIRTLDHALHSGMYGGPVPDATMAAIRLFNSFWDESGAVAVDGLAAHTAATPDYPVERFRAEAGMLVRTEFIGEGTILDRLWHQPAITVTGIDVPDVVNASNTLMPVVRARISVRIAPGQSAADVFAAMQAHIAQHTPFGAEVAYDKIDLGEAFLVDTSGEYVTAMKAALTAGFGKATVEMGVGGSIPFIAELVEVFPQAQILITGVEDADSRAHSPNESLHLASFRKAILSEASFLTALAKRA